MPKPCDRGRHRRWHWREVLDAIYHVLRQGCPWRFLADSFPPWRTVCRWFGELRDSGGFEGLNHHLVQIDRVRVGREPMPSAAVIDSQVDQESALVLPGTVTHVRWVAAHLGLNGV